MWKALRLLTTFLCAQVCAGQVSYRVVRAAREDGTNGEFPGSADFGGTLNQGSPRETSTLEPYLGKPVMQQESRELFGWFCVIIVVIILELYDTDDDEPGGIFNDDDFWGPLGGGGRSSRGKFYLHRRLDDGEVSSTPTQVLTNLTVTDPVHGSIVYPVYLDVGDGGEGVVRFPLSYSSQVNGDGTGLCDECSLSAIVGECVSGDCDAIDIEATNDNMQIQSSIFGDPHMVGLLGQKIDWVGEDGGWYCLISDGEDIQLNVRVTAPMPDEFPDRQLVSGVSVLLGNNHSLVMEVKNPYTIQTDGCVSDSALPCLADGALRILVDEMEAPDLQVPTENVVLEEGVYMSATNLPAECRPFGGDRIWAAQFEEMTAARRSLRAMSSTLEKWVLQPSTLAAPTWCAKYLEAGVDELLATQSNHATIHIATATADLRINIGVNHQELVVDENGSTVVPELEFWQTDVGLEWHRFSETVGGMLGDTSRLVFDSAGRPIREGLGAISCPVESYRVASALNEYVKPVPSK